MALSQREELVRKRELAVRHKELVKNSGNGGGTIVLNSVRKVFQV
jgi:hypothetical protein